MKTTDIKLKPSLLALFVVSTLLSGCGDDDEVVVTPEPTPPAVVMQTYTVTVTNLTANQPMSPVIVASHSADAMLWQAGETASLAIEKMAEGGDTADIAALEAVTNSVNGAGMLMPGMTETLTLTLAEADVANLSLVTMLVNTNDAFTGVNGVNIAEMDVDIPIMMHYMAYDAGTEANTEAKGSMPGPADGGEGFNAARDDVNFVHIHPGVISQYDGLADSVLMPSHRFDNPVLAVTITRTE
ncbi:spondin domain-containing protein [Shewanella holmiensis]|uniref:Spondin domain-containing protein n=1 Tax=Shewanella holmiensis TaxID=2952222 RepID=A0A9X3ANL8_9GAMM|nr:spondin domain-containing protein [Shewanella holmiensis]MCT7942017.1 spondin domain-containing protein [Shewanella holmiensis]